MATASFMVVQAGPHTSIQDGGRIGHMRFGVPASGPMDRQSFAAANTALGNPAGQTAIEVSMGGLVLDCTEGTISFAVAGGGFRVTLGDTQLPAWTVATIAAGQRLSIRPGGWGNWTTLAFAGHIQAKRWLGSTATHALSGFGGGTLALGGRIAIADAEVRKNREGEIPLPPPPPARSSVRVVLGPQDRFFEPAAIKTFLSKTFTLTDAYDRMGVRLSGPKLGLASALDMPSEAIVRGSVQVAGDGVATVLLADHQTTGGYPKIATILGPDLDGFVQLRSHIGVRFEAVEPPAAIAALRASTAAKESYLEILKRRTH